MEKQEIISRINRYIHEATSILSKWLEGKLPKLTEKWWEQCVLNVLNEGQRKHISPAVSSLDSLDLSALLTVTDRNWYSLREQFYLNSQDRKSISDMRAVRNNWAHCGSAMPGKENIVRDLETLCQFFECLGDGSDIVKDIHEFLASIRKSDLSKINQSDFVQATDQSETQQAYVSPTIQKGDMVVLTSDPQKKGYVTDVSTIGDDLQYTLFIDNEIRHYYGGQISPVPKAVSKKADPIFLTKSYLTAFQVTNPSYNSLYSLNSARIDFVPYQFRPVLKIIKSDQPRLLIADSVGVGKTIEAGLIMKELQARSEAESILIICPKPLVAERKWELEMKRFDEDFTQLDGDTFRRAIIDTDRDGVWPEKHIKTVIPYSLLTKEILYGKSGTGRRRSSGLLNLDTPPHFDLVIVDEAHHIRNRNTNAYIGVEYFCRNADAVVLLTATPIQTDDENLYTLLNLLRPDIVTDLDTFQLMARPNPYINQAVLAARTASGQWRQAVSNALNLACESQWGSNVVRKDPRYHSAIKALAKPEISQDERIDLISNLEGLHSFSGMINRTRRQDIQDFCVRRPYTVKVPFTQPQKELHDGLLRFEAAALSIQHNNQNVAFMMGTIRRQAASCIFGLAPFLQSLLARRIDQIAIDAGLDLESNPFDDPEILSTLKELAAELLQKAENLPEQDPKFDAMLEVIAQKQAEENNKIIIFSSFKHTLAYLRKKLSMYDLRIAQVDGSVKDQDRLELRNRFQLSRKAPEALDVLLFTEVGCEGLDYQFCNMMINYDLPWNPMRIEQRIGRIDRRGQQSEVVQIYNMITDGTIDADIYERCLMRIGVFESSIGECEEILGAITKSIQDISLDPNLTDEERRRKLAQMADNKVRKVKELQRLEQEQKQMFGFDLPRFALNQEVQDAEDPWISPDMIQSMIRNYLNRALGEGVYIQGEGPIKNLRLSEANRQKLLSDCRKLGLPKSQTLRQWEKFLKGVESNAKITFFSEYAEQNRDSLFITAGHPLTRQAAAIFDEKDARYLTIKAACACPEISAGKYVFAIYQWDYCGSQRQHTLKAICKNGFLQKELLELLQSAQDVNISLPSEKSWNELEDLHHQLWQTEQKTYKERMEAERVMKLESLTFQFENSKRALQAKLQDAENDKIRRMYEGQMSKSEFAYKEKCSRLDEGVKQADILFRIFIKGILIVE